MFELCPLARVSWIHYLVEKSIWNVLRVLITRSFDQSICDIDGLTTRTQGPRYFHVSFLAINQLWTDTICFHFDRTMIEFDKE